MSHSNPNFIDCFIYCYQFPKGMHNAWDTFVLQWIKAEYWRCIYLVKQEPKFLDILIMQGFALEKDPIFRWSCTSIFPPPPFVIKDFFLFNWTSLVGIVCQWFGQNVWHSCLEADAKWSMCGQMCKKPMRQPCDTATTILGKHVKWVVKYQYICHTRLH